MLLKSSQLRGGLFPAENINPKRQDAKNYALLVSYDIELEISTLTDETTKTVLLAPRIKELIEQADGIFQKSTTLEITYNTARVFFIAGKHDKALDWLNMILNERATSVRQDLNTGARILFLVIHYQLGNYKLLKGTILSTKKSLKYKGRLFKAEKAVLDSLQKLIPAETKKEEQEIFNSLLIILNRIFKDPKEPKPAVLDDVSAWIESKLTGKTLGKILAENYRKEFGHPK